MLLSSLACWEGMRDVLSDGFTGWLGQHAELKDGLV
jgi:hypothetical protein